MAEIFETIMMVLFGLSWPFNIVKSYRSRTAAGKSLMFELLLWTGYVFGIASKFLRGKLTYVVVFYTINLLFVTTDIVLYLRNKRLDEAKKAVAAE